MANCHDLFKQFNINLNITKTKRDNLMSARDTLRKKIKKYFNEHHSDYKPQFFIQGSYKTGTLIRTKDDTCDLDDGVHFHTEPDVSPTTLQSWVYNAVKGHTTGGQSHKNKCIRVVYKNDYHIDLPVYKESSDDTYPFLTVKNKDWDEEESDPKGFIEWFNAKKTELITRQVRYLKAWGDHVRNNMPSGLAMTLFVEKWNQEDDRDDLSLRDTLINLRYQLGLNWAIYMPTKPCDNVLADYSIEFRDKFFEALDDFISDTEAAINEESQYKASLLWRKHLGDNFPLGKKNDTSDKAAIIGITRRAIHKPYLLG